MNQNYSGLSLAEVEASRRRYGRNVLTPPREVSLMEKIGRCFQNWYLRFITVFSIVVIGGWVILRQAAWQALPLRSWIIVPLGVFLFVFTLLIVFLGGKWNDKKRRMEVDELVMILLFATTLSVGIAYYKCVFAETGGLSMFFEPIGIVVAILLATVVGYILEKRNEKTFKSLNAVNDELLVKVIREGKVTQVQRWEVVVGDIMLVEAGDEIAADAELLDSLHLVVNESSLTGELQCNKTADAASFDKEAVYPSNHVMKGCTVIEGYGTARVLAVGDATASGKLFQSVQVKEGIATPLSQKLNQLAKLITKFSYTITTVVIVGRMLVYIWQNGGMGESLDFVLYCLETLMIAVALIVVSVPEGLPMAVTLSLAYNMKRLMKQNTLPRTMHACETMGAVSVICTDKTGTLTQNQMRVSETNFFNLANQQLTDDTLSHLIIASIAVNSTANIDVSNPQNMQVIGNPTEGALLLWLQQHNINYEQVRGDFTIIDRLPFTTEIKYMATIASRPDSKEKLVFIKGAPEIVMEMCDLSDSMRQQYAQELLVYQQRAMRTLAFAYKKIDDDERTIFGGKVCIKDLSMLGFVAIADPVRRDVPQAIRDCIAAGIDIKIVTGDTTGTAKEIARQIGLWNDDDTDERVMQGSDIAACTDEQLEQRLPAVKIIPRARPNDKERIVRALRHNGKVVAVTGDGTNDAPALNVADVGLSMGDGTAVAKEASDMTIIDNSFRTIANAVMWGRSLYKNIKRFVMFQLIVNVVACLIVSIGAFVDVESPLSVTQMLWVNLIMDTFAALAFASLAPNPSVMQEKPRDVDEHILKGIGGHILCISLLFTIVLVGLLFVFKHLDVHSIYNLDFAWKATNGLNPYELGLFFTFFVMMQFWNMFNVKATLSDDMAFANITWRQSKEFIIILLVILLGQIGIMQIPILQEMFNIPQGGLYPLDWVIVIASSSLVLWFGEIGRMVARRK